MEVSVVNIGPIYRVYFDGKRAMDITDATGGYPVMYRNGVLSQFLNQAISHVATVLLSEGRPETTLLGLLVVAKKDQIIEAIFETVAAANQQEEENDE